MNAFLLLVITSVGYLIAYYTYGRFLSRKIFSIDPTKVTPSKMFEDGKDYVPSKRHVLFGHHFTSIAGTGPIVGPAIGVIWGWLPAILWVFFGSIFMGAVHDFAALKISLRNDGKSISEITGKYISPWSRKLFFVIVFFSLLIVLAIFGMVIAIIFAKFPESVFPVWMQIPIAVFLGYIVYKKKGNLKLFTFLSVLCLYLTVVLGHFLPFKMPEIMGIPATGIWTILLLVYAYIASTLSVTTLLQPRDYINAWQLYIALGFIIFGIGITAFLVDFIIPAPMINLHPKGAPPIWPFLFITIACGAISGFHSLVASGTSSKQMHSESDAQFVGYGGMLIESLLATIVIIAATAGLGLAYTAYGHETLTGIEAWNTHYSSWVASAGLGAKLEAVVIGASNILANLGIPKAFGIVFLGVFIASFAGTTLDSATRVQRYIIAEIFTDSRFSFLANKWIATGIAVVTAAILAFSSGADGKGALLLWPLFGSVNQLLAALALMVATLYLRHKPGLRYLVTGIPCVFMLIITIWGAILNQISFFTDKKVILILVNLIILGLAVMIVLESFKVFFLKRGNEKPHPPAPSPNFGGGEKD